MRPLAPPLAPPELAWRQGWMPLDATGVRDFAERHPTWDGRGVLVAILDSGIDPSVPGLQRTSSGEAKILDLRDFSGEGRIRLDPVANRGDTVLVAGRVLAGMSRVRAFDADGPWFAGAIAEVELGDPDAADLNGDGDVADTLALIVTRASDGWVLFADRDGDATVANDRPVHDYRLAREWFGWAPRGREPYVALAANFSEDGAAPVLDLYFDTSGHGTHVAGIAAGHDLYGVPGFDGVAPGAQLLGLKIADNAQGGVSRTGSMLRAIDYAIRLAGERQLPLVLNMSFGVGNEREGTAVIDRLIDSTMALHPGVAFTISAGNDGPGLSTIGFPGSARRAISVGALFPGVFLTDGTGPVPPDQVADFSGRGGEIAAPHFVVPGVAFSTVPAWDRGNERKGGTSMAAPHAAGLVARLLSGARERGLSPSGATVRQALMVTATPVPGATFIDAGTGVPNLSRAWTWLAAHPDVALLEVTAAPGVTGALIDSAGLVRFALSGVPSHHATLALRTQAAWLRAPASVALTSGGATVEVRPDPAVLATPGVHVAVLGAWGADTSVGPLARLVTTVAVPHRADSVSLSLQLDRGGLARVPFEVLPGRPFAIVVDAGTSAGAMAYLHEPRGIPWRGGHARPAGSGEEAARFEVLLQDVIPGTWELVIQASPMAAARVQGAIRRAPLILATGLTPGGAPQVTLTGASPGSLTVEAGAGIIGGVQDMTLSPRGSDRRDLSVVVPPWARGIQVDVQMPPEAWSRFTDLGLSLFDEQGRQLATQPVNYAVGRLEHALVPSPVERRYRLSLYPGLASAADDAPWPINVALRFYADAAQPLAPLGQRGLQLDKGTAGLVTFEAGTVPAPAAGLRPLYLVLVRTGEDDIWAGEVGGSPVPGPSTP